MRLFILLFIAAGITPLAGCGGGDEPAVTTTPNEIQAYREANPGMLIGDDDDEAGGP